MLKFMREIYDPVLLIVGVAFLAIMLPAIFLDKLLGLYPEPLRLCMCQCF